mmetsp:Transcript_5102/g.4460  ORF Transcript_5102/g.4460 Transcript_5102/m.4460 type:complete len:177 (+) Transcript_5102:1-531(+)
MYNGITRDIEQELLGCLRYLGIKFYAYNVLAGGILSGKHKYEDYDNKTIQKGRFYGDSPWAQFYRHRFWSKSKFEGIDILKDALQKAYDGKVTLVEASCRWIMHHSMLGKEDAVILGASTIKHFNSNMAALKDKEPLKKEVVDAFDQAWKLSRGACPSYVGNHMTIKYLKPINGGQ